MPDNVLRVDRDSNFKTINLYAVADDEGLSAKAAGIHTYLVTRPDGWKFNKADIIKTFDDGRTAIDSGLDELKEKNYLSVDQDQREDGTFIWKWTIREVPSTIPRKSTTIPPKPNDGESNDGKQGDLVLEDGSKKEFSKHIYPDWMHQEFVNILGGDPPHPSETRDRKPKYQAFWDEHLCDLDEPRKWWRALLKCVRDAEWDGKSRAHEMPESFGRNEGRRDRWIQEAKERLGNTASSLRERASGISYDPHAAEQLKQQADG